MKVLRSLISLGLLPFAAAAVASPITVSGMVGGKNQIVSIAVNGGSAYSVYAGPQAASFAGDNFEAYCVDLAHFQYPPVTFDVNTVAADGFLPNGARVAQLVNKYGTSVTTADEGAALQLAIWDVLIDGGDGTGGGNFIASGLSAGATTLFASYLADPLLAVSTVATVYNPTTHPNGNSNQALIGPGGDHLTNQAVPEPASMIALGVGGLALVRRRRKMA